MDRRLILSVFLFTLGGCALGPASAGDARADVERALQRYSGLLLTMDADGIAAMYTADGEMGDSGEKPHRGREQIKAFLKSFTNVRVLSNVMTSESVDVTGTTAVQRGGYTQSARIDDKETVHVRGRFEAIWARQPDRTWLIARMTTLPAA